MKKILLVLSTIVLAFGLFACASKTTQTTAENNEVVTPQEPKNVEPQKTKEKLIMVTNCEFPPYEYIDNGVYKGIDVDIAKIIGSKLEVDVEILDVAFDSILPTLMSGKGDFAMAGMTVTEDRLQNVDFSHTYQTAIQNVIIKNESNIASIEDLAEKKIGVVSGFTADIYATDDFGEDYIERYKNAYDAVQALKTGKVDAVMIDDQVAKNFVETTEGLRILDTPYAEEEYAAAVKKGDTELLNKINAVIDELKADGSFAKIVSSYIK